MHFLIINAEKTRNSKTKVSKARDMSNTKMLLGKLYNFKDTFAWVYQYILCKFTDILGFKVWNEIEVIKIWPTILKNK